MNKLVLFTNRSGSTLLCDIIAYADGCINLGEGIHSVARHYNYNREQNKTTELYRKFSETNLATKYVTTKNRGSDFIEYSRAIRDRSLLLHNTTESWVAKYNLEIIIFDNNFIQRCVDNNVCFYITHRENIVDQFVSRINARYRYEVAKHKNEGFIYTNNTPVENYHTMIVKFDWLQQCMVTFLEQLMLWRVIYERLKDHVNVVSYERCIQPMDFTSIGINHDTVTKYLQEKQHLIPTPINTTNIIVVDDHPKPIIGAWEQTLYFISKHKHLVEI